MTKPAIESEAASSQFLLQPHDLKKADLVVPAPHQGTSVRAGTLSRFCHSGMYVGNHRVLHQDDAGLREVHLKEFVSPKGALVLRREPLEWSQGEQVVQSAFVRGSEPGKSVLPRSSTAPYWLLGTSSPLMFVAAVGKDLKSILQEERAFYCPSGLVMAFQRASVPIIDSKRQVGATPASIARVRDIVFAGWLEVGVASARG